MNVAFLVGWAFNVAASANLPALVLVLFWKRATRQGITAAISVGLLSSVVWLLLSEPAYKNVYGLATPGVVPFSQLPVSWPRSACQTAVNVGDADYHPQFPYGLGLGYPTLFHIGKLDQTAGPAGGCTN